MLQARSGVFWLFARFRVFFLRTPLRALLLHAFVRAGFRTLFLTSDSAMRSTQHKPLDEQTILITGASSGIGLATAQRAANAGAAVVLVARNTEAIEAEASRIEADGGRALAIGADVADLDSVRRAADLAAAQFGGIDTWVNNAGTSIYGRLEETDLVDARRLFETNFWGLVNGSVEALRLWRQAIARNVSDDPQNFALINIGSVLSDRAIPLQGFYCASKHAVKGFTDALRMEVMEDDLPVSVTLIKPGSIDTPYTEHARNLTGRKPTVPPPVYSPKLVAKAVLHCACHPKRDLIVGGGGRMISAAGLGGKHVDRAMAGTITEQQLEDGPDLNPSDSLYTPASDGSVFGNYSGHTRKTSATTTAAKHPGLTAAAVLGAGAAAGLGLAWLLRRSGDDDNGGNAPRGRGPSPYEPGVYGPRRDTPLGHDYRQPAHEPRVRPAGDPLTNAGSDRDDLEVGLPPTVKPESMAGRTSAGRATSTTDGERFRVEGTRGAPHTR